MRAIIFGISGQDGSYLAKYLLDKGYEVIGTSRNPNSESFINLQRVGVKDIEILPMSIRDFDSTYKVLNTYKPDELYNLSGLTSVHLSFEQPAETMESILIGTVNILETLRRIDYPIRFYNSGSSECFGDTGSHAANEKTNHAPQSPYGVAKSAAQLLVRSRREAHGIFACTGILFNHESPLRSERFVTQKIVMSAARIAKGSSEKLQLGNIKACRDWGWAPEYVTAMWSIIRSQLPDDYVIATGRTESLEYFISQSFAFFGLEWTDHVVHTKDLIRPSDITWTKGDPQKIENTLKWKATKDVDYVIQNMCESALT